MVSMFTSSIPTRCASLFKAEGDVSQPLRRRFADTSFTTFIPISIVISIGTIRTSPRSEPSGSIYRGCFEDKLSDRILKKAKYVDGQMTAEVSRL